MVPPIAASLQLQQACKHVQVHQSCHLRRCLAVPPMSRCPQARPTHRNSTVLPAGAHGGRPATLVQQRAGRHCTVLRAARAAPVLESQPMLSDLLTVSTGPWETLAWKAALDIVLPILCLWGLLKVVNYAADRARTTIDARVAGETDVVEELKRRSTLAGLVLLALRTPAQFMLPPWIFAYTLRTALNIIDLCVNKYKPQLPQVVGYCIKQVSAQLVPFDAALQTLLSISGVLFITWFFIKAKDILIREVILVRAVRSGRTDLERVWLPFSLLVTWAAILACGLSVCSALSINLKPLLAVGGAGGIAAGFASQQLLLNLVAGANLLFTRPFIAGDQIVFAGGCDIEGTVEGVEITRTLLRTADGTLVALPNKTVADLIVFNRTRTLEKAASPPPAAAADAATPLRRVMCFTLQLSRDLEPRLEAIRSDVRELLNRITKEQLIASGLQPAPSPTASSSSQAEELLEVEEAVVAEPQPLLVSITLKKLTADSIALFVRCEMLLPATTMPDAVERQTEQTLITISGLVREKYGAVLLW